MDVEKRVNPVSEGEGVTAVNSWNLETQLDLHVGGSIRRCDYLPWWVGKLVHGSILSSVV